MALFTLTDIKIGGKGSVNIGFGEGSQILPSRYVNNTYRYPIDIGDTDKGHYVVIHINEQTKTQFKGESTSDLPTIFENKRFGALSEVARVSGLLLNAFQSEQNAAREGFVADPNVSFSNALTQKSLLDNLRLSGQSLEIAKTIIETASAAGEASVSMLRQLSSGQGLRTIRRTTDTIALYMPDTLNFTHNQTYSSMELGGGAFAGLAALADAGRSIASGGDIAKVIGGNLSPFILSQLARGFGNAGSAVFAAATGTVTNPQLELIYTSPAFRTFRFDFMLYPRSEKEALEVQNILERLKFHQAPEILTQGSGALGGFFLVPPSEFDIKFYYNGSINPNIPPISTCVLNQIDLDYAPNGFATYEKTGQFKPRIGGTGMPVAIRLSLEFMETEILTKESFATSHYARKYGTNALSQQSSMLAEQESFFRE
jgi:hypothetical protein